jgi:hypothetical protein
MSMIFLQSEPQPPKRSPAHAERSQPGRSTIRTAPPGGSLSMPLIGPGRYMTIRN